jgi:hypothetical protein
MSNQVQFAKCAQACAVFSFLIRGGRKNDARANIHVPVGCPVEATADSIGGTWKAVILYYLF